MNDAQAYQSGQFSLLFEVSGEYKGGEKFRSVLDARSERDAMRKVLSELGAEMNRVVDIQAEAV